MHRVLRLEHGMLVETNPRPSVGALRGSGALAFQYFGRPGESLYTTPTRPYFPSSQVTRRLLLVRAAPWSNPTGGGPMRWIVTHLRAH
jgi:hypothetical protein